MRSCLCVFSCDEMLKQLYIWADTGLHHCAVTVSLLRSMPRVSPCLFWLWLSKDPTPPPRSPIGQGWCRWWAWLHNMAPDILVTQIYAALYKQVQTKHKNSENEDTLVKTVHRCCKEVWLGQGDNSQAAPPPQGPSKLASQYIFSCWRSVPCDSYLYLHDSRRHPPPAMGPAAWGLSSGGSELPPSCAGHCHYLGLPLENGPSLFLPSVPQFCLFSHAPWASQPGLPCAQKANPASRVPQSLCWTWPNFSFLFDNFLSHEQKLGTFRKRENKVNFA